MGDRQPIRLPKSVIDALLRDAGHAPQDWHPDAHFKRETPPLRPFPQTQRRIVTNSTPGR